MVKKQAKRQLFKKQKELKEKEMRKTSGGVLNPKESFEINRPENKDRFF